MLISGSIWQASYNHGCARFSHWSGGTDGGDSTGVSSQQPARPTCRAHVESFLLRCARG